MAAAALKRTADDREFLTRELTAVEASGQPTRLATALKFLGMAFIAPVVVFIALLGGAIAALAWPGPPVRKDKKD